MRGHGGVPQIGVAAFGSHAPPKRVDLAREFVRVLSECCSDAVLVLGGYRGLMKVVVDEAVERGLGVMLVIPRDYEADEFPARVVVVRTGMGKRERSGVLVRSSDVLVSLGGGIGTLTEVLMAYSYGIPVVQVVNYSMEDFLTDRFARCFAKGVLDRRVGGSIIYVGRGVEAAVRACEAVGVKCSREG